MQNRNKKYDEKHLYNTKYPLFGQIIIIYDYSMVRHIVLLASTHLLLPHRYRPQYQDPRIRFFY